MAATAPAGGVACHNRLSAAITGECFFASGLQRQGAIPRHTRNHQDHGADRACFIRRSTRVARTRGGRELETNSSSPADRAHPERSLPQQKQAEGHGRFPRMKNKIQNGSAMPDAVPRQAALAGPERKPPQLGCRKRRRSRRSLGSRSSSTPWPQQMPVSRYAPAMRPSPLGWRPHPRPAPPPRG